MSFDHQWYKNRVKLVQSQYKTLYDVALQEYLPEAEGLMEGKAFGDEMITFRQNVYFTLVDMTSSTSIGKTSQSKSNLPIDTIFGNATFGWESPHAPRLAQGGTLSFFGNDRPISKIKFFIRSIDSFKQIRPIEEPNVSFTGTMLSYDYELPSDEQLWIDVNLKPDVFNHAWNEFRSGSWVGGSLRVNTSDLKGFYSCWSPVLDRFQNIKILQSVELVTNQAELPLDRFGELDGVTTDFSLHLFGKTHYLSSKKECKELEAIENESFLDGGDKTPNTSVTEQNVQQPEKRRKRGLLW